MTTLPDPAQGRIAANLLQELADDAQWDESFAASASQLEQLAAEALEEYRAATGDASAKLRLSRASRAGGKGKR